jgi:two-component system, NtrC family, sensor kinase
LISTGKRLCLGGNSSGADEYALTTQRILRYSNRAATRIEFLIGASGMILELSGCDALELGLLDSEVRYRWELAIRPQPASRFTVAANPPSDSSGPPECDAPAPGGAGPYRSVAQMRFTVDEHTAGWLQLKSLRPRWFTKKRLDFHEGLAEILGLAIANQRTQWALRERVKELTCLYGISRIAQLSGPALDDVLQRLVELLPPAWQFPGIACARILLDRRAFTTGGFREGPHRQSADLTVGGKLRGSVEVYYKEERPEFAEGPFLPEERSLIDTVAREVSLIVERRETEEYQSALQAQLRHADRLATIGQLAAGVAHELNEPLGSILGFAQLIQKDPDLPDGAARDAEKVVKASLHAREVIHKLLVFSRQKTPVKSRVNLNRIVDEGLYFLESRCAKAGIALVSQLAPGPPEINAEASQIHQVLVNLVVNSIQAMPEGGTLTIETRSSAESVWLIIQDTGIGMSDEVQEKIYTPFFTTKGFDQGTGLGLAVVHGIVTSHGGTIRVESAPGKGARFEIRFPAAKSHE